MTDEDIIKLSDPEKAAIIKRVLNSRDGKKFRAILEIHFQTHLPSATVAGYDANRMFYHDGQRSVFCLFDQVLSGQWDREQPDPMKDDDDEPSEPL